MNTKLLCYILCGLLFVSIFLWVVFEWKLNQEGFETNIDHLSIDWTIESQIPNIIWTFWDGDIPPFVKRCIQSWKQHNPNYKIIVLNKTNISEYLPDVDFHHMRAANDSAQRYSDYIRTHVLARYGGFWFDASIICRRSNQWLHTIQNETGVEFIGYYINRFTSPEYVKSSPIIESWCFACIPGSTFVQDWRDEFMKLNDHKDAKQYVDNVVKSGVNLQNLQYIEYLAIHVAAQKVVQHNPDKYKLHLLKAEDTAFKHMVDDNGTWDDGNATNRILEKRHTDQPLLKLVGFVRTGVIDECAKRNIDIETLFM